MHAIVIDKPGEPDVLTWSPVADPAAGPDEVVLDVAAAGVNRADLQQRRGNYPPPAGASEYPGLEAAGTISAVGEGVTGWRVGDEACALLAGGGYAERVAVPAGQLLPIPRGVSPVEAAGLPEAACTVWSNVFMRGELLSGESFLVHGGAGGVGSFAIQLAKAVGARVTCTAGGPEKVRRCLDIGADRAIDYRSEDFVEAGPYDVILDVMGASYLPRNVSALATGGRLLVIGFQGGSKGELNLVELAAKRAAVHATTLRSRPLDEKAEIVAGVREHVWPLIESGAVRPIIDCTVPMADAAAAHRMLEASTHVGKVILTTNDENE